MHESYCAKVGPVADGSPQLAQRPPPYDDARVGQLRYGKFRARQKKIRFGFFAKYLPKECREKKDIFTCGSSASPGLQAALHARGQALAAGQPADNFGHGSREQSKVTARDSFDRYREVSDDLFQ